VIAPVAALWQSKPVFALFQWTALPVSLNTPSAEYLSTSTPPLLLTAVYVFATQFPAVMVPGGGEWMTRSLVSGPTVRA
jgi:hypothetical protein